MTNPWFLIAMQLWQQIERLPVKPRSRWPSWAPPQLHFGFLNLPMGTSAAEMCLRRGRSSKLDNDRSHLPIHGADAPHIQPVVVPVEGRQPRDQDGQRKVLTPHRVRPHQRDGGWCHVRDGCLLGNARGVSQPCAMGNNGVNFALKTILFADEASNTSMLGITMPSKGVRAGLG